MDRAEPKDTPMAKSKKKQAVAKSAAKARKQSESQSGSKKVALGVVQAGTKQANAIEMLRSPGGTTIETLMKATEWQQHSVRGFLAGVVRKRLKLDLVSSVVDGERVYRVTGGGPKKAAEGQVRQDKA
jgi:hypothetical protein